MQHITVNTNTTELDEKHTIAQAILAIKYDLTPHHTVRYWHYVTLATQTQNTQTTTHNGRG